MTAFLALAHGPCLPHVLWSQRLVALGTAVAVTLFTVGCEPPRPVQPEAAGDHADHDGHDHGDHAGHDHGDHEGAEGHGAEEAHEHPETLAEGVAMVRGLIAQVESALSGEDTSAADNHVHDLGHLLVDMEAKAEQLEGDVKQAVSNLIDAFGELDEKIHDEGEPVFADIAERVEEAMKTLDAYVEQISQAEVAPGDDQASDAAEGDAAEGDADAE